MKASERFYEKQVNYFVCSVYINYNRSMMVQVSSAQELLRLINDAVVPHNEFGEWFLYETASETCRRVVATGVTSNPKPLPERLEPLLQKKTVVLAVSNQVLTLLHVLLLPNHCTNQYCMYYYQYWEKDAVTFGKPPVQYVQDVCSTASSSGDEEDDQMSTMLQMEQPDGNEEE